jgi:predicted DNA-binding transcriptional regulator AlpA
MKNTHIDLLPLTGFLRLSQIIGRPKSCPPIPGLIPISKATWYLWQKSGRAPKPVKFSERIAAYRVEDIREFLTSLAEA